MNLRLLGLILIGGAFLSSTLPCAMAGEEVSYKEASYKDTGGGVTIRDTPFRASVSLRGGYDDNVLTSHTDKQKSWFTNVYAQVNADFSNPRTTLTIGISGGSTYYWDLDGDPWDYSATLSLEVIHRASSRLTLSAKVYATYQVEPDFSLLIGNERSNGQYFYGNSLFTARYQWSPRFSTVSSYSLVGVFYENSDAANINDRFEHYFSTEFRYLIHPTTTLVGEYRFAYFDYTDNNSRDGHSHYFLVGVDQTFSPRFNFSIRAGVEVRDTDADGTRTEPYAEGTLTYLYGRFSSVSWVNRLGLEQSDLGSATHRLSYRTGIQVRHGFTAKLSLYLAGFYHYNDYDTFEENVFDLSTGLTFAVNRNFSVDVGYSYTVLDSDVSLREYDRNRFHVGGTFAF